MQNLSTRILLILSLLSATASYANTPTRQLESSITIPTLGPNGTESSITLTNNEVIDLEKLSEEAKLASYSGVLGTAPNNQTISAVGTSYEETPTGPELSLIWSQTLSNGLYYEGRVYGQYNMRSQNPIYPNASVSSEDNPLGVEAMGKIGYNFHTNDDYNITPYLRLQAGKDMTLVYQDTQGNYIHSSSYAAMLGFRQTFILNNKVSPYIDIYSGITSIKLTGVLSSNGQNVYRQAPVMQWSLVNEFGVSYRITNHQATAPFFQYIYTGTNPSAEAAKSYDDGGFNVTSLTVTTITAGAKYSYAW